MKVPPPNMIIGLTGAACMLALIGMELKSGVARMGLKLRIRRAKGAGPFFAILALQLFTAAVFAAFGMARINLMHLNPENHPDRSPAHEPRLIEFDPNVQTK